MNIDKTIVAETNGHRWINVEFKVGLLCACLDCGIMRKADDTNKPCPGIVKITLR